MKAENRNKLLAALFHLRSIIYAEMINNKEKHLSDVDNRAMVLIDRNIKSIEKQLNRAIKLSWLSDRQVNNKV